MLSRTKTLVILFGKGGLSDVGRHAVLAALEQPNVEFKVLTQHPELLEESNWNCGCPGGHADAFSEEDRKRFSVIPVKSWSDTTLSEHFQGATGVVSCLGNRQPFIGGWVAQEGNQAVIQGMKEHNVERAVALSSCGVEEDWPPLEFHPGGKILSFIFTVIGRKCFKDLTLMERAYRASSLDYLLVRPVGIGEDVVPNGTWVFQKKKYEDKIGLNMAKMDCARFMVKEALNPTMHKTAVLIGTEEENE